MHLIKGYGLRKLLTEFPNKNWTKGGLDTLIKKLRETGSDQRKKGNGRPKIARIEKNITMVDELVLSQEDQPHTHLSTRQILGETGIHNFTAEIFFL